MFCKDQVVPSKKFKDNFDEIDWKKKDFKTYVSEFLAKEKSWYDGQSERSIPDYNDIKDKRNEEINE
jgi:hypothetical protein